MVNGWKECLITDALKQDGIKIGPFGSQLKKEMLLNDGFLKVYGQENVYENDFNIGDRYLTREHFEKLKSCEILPGDFLMSTMGTIGKCAIVPPNIMPGIMDSHLIRLRFDESMINPEYVLQLFSDQYSFLQDQIQKLAVGGIMDGLSVGIVSNIRIVFPEDLEEQNCIVSTLKDADKLMHESQLLIEKCQAMKQGCLQHMFPRKGQTEPDVRLPGFTGAWEQRKLSEEMENFIVPMRDKPRVFGGDIPWTRIEDIEGRYLNGTKSHQYVSKETIQSMNLQVIPKGSLIVSMSATFGAVAEVTTDLITNQTFIGMVPKSKNELDFWYTYFHSDAARRYMQLESAGSTIFYITREKFEEMPVTLPANHTERFALGDFFLKLDNLITLHQRKCKKYKMIKQGMMEDLLTGKVRLK